MAASLKVLKQSRSWKIKDSNNSEDIEKLFGSGNVSNTKPAPCNKYWTLYVCLFGVFALFLFGIVVGFYLRADPEVFNECTQNHHKRKDGFDKEKLQAVHNNIVYFMSGDRIGQYNRDLLSLSQPITDEDWEKSTAEYVENAFRKFEFDHVEVEEHQVVITSPDPNKPNTLELLTLDDSSLRNGSSLVSKKQQQKWELKKTNFVAFSPSGNIRGPILYGHEGTLVDLLQIQKNNVSLNGSLLLLQLGGITVPEKVRNAEKFGAVGVILFCYHDNSSFNGDCDPESPYVSAADFSAIEEDRYPRIPVEAVTPDVALSILKRINGTSLQNASLSDFIKVKTFSKGSSDVGVHLEVNTVPTPKTVYNVIGTCYGSDEVDREVIIGAGSQVWNQSTNSTRYLNLAVLLELGNSLEYIRKTQGWRPRRTLKMIFHGGKTLSNVGLVRYIKNHRHILEEQGVSYIDLDLSEKGHRFMEVETSPSLVAMVRKAALMVPDPEDSDISLADRWPELSHDLFLTNQYPVHKYKKASWYPVLQDIGMTSVVVKSIQSDKVSGQLLPGEVTHHYRYHLATARVVSHMLLQFVDNPKLPFDVEFTSRLVVKTMNDSLNKLKQFIEFPKDKLESLETSLHRLAQLPQNFTSKSTSKQCVTDLYLRSYNDIVTKLDRVFIEKLPNHRHRDYLLTSDRVTGTLSVLLDAVNSYLMTGKLDPVYRTLSVFTHSLQQFHTEINTLLTESV